MNESDIRKLDALRADYAAVTGSPFSAFYCPFLFRDEDVDLCRAHLVNQAFSGASKRWTIQRKDVDGFFGSAFESDFVKIQLRRDPSEAPFAILADKSRSKKLEPAVFLDGEKIDHYVARGPMPAEHSKFAVDFAGQTVSLGLKIHPNKTLDAAEGNWEIRVEKDVRIGAFVSLLKAAHLALYDMLGYRYALSAGGHFLGFTILGSFFSQNQGQSKQKILENAPRHFADFANMVRPVQAGGTDAKGTADDGLLYICTRGTEIRWAFLVHVRTGDSLHAVLVPTFDDPAGIDRFLTFLRDDDETLDAIPAKFEGDKWLAAKEPKHLIWPKPAGLL